MAGQGEEWDTLSKTVQQLGLAEFVLLLILVGGLFVFSFLERDNLYLSELLAHTAAR